MVFPLFRVVVLLGMAVASSGLDECSNPPPGVGPDWWLRCALQLGLDECDGKRKTCVALFSFLSLIRHPSSSSPTQSFFSWHAPN